MLQQILRALKAQLVTVSLLLALPCCLPPDAFLCIYYFSEINSVTHLCSDVNVLQGFGCLPCPLFAVSLIYSYSNWHPNLLCHPNTQICHVILTPKSHPSPTSCSLCHTLPPHSVTTLGHDRWCHLLNSPIRPVHYFESTLFCKSLFFRTFGILHIGQRLQWN